MAVAIDFESFYSKQTGISTQGAWHYLQDPACEIYMVAVFGEGIDFVGRPEDFDWWALDGKVLIAHNLAWDGLVLGILQERGIVPEGLKFGGSGCTANLSVYLGAPRNLAGAAKQLLGIDLSKDLRTWMKGKTWANAVDAGKEQELRDYCRRDAQACHAIWEKYSVHWPEHERALAQQTMLMGWRGFRVDTERVEAGIAHLERLKFDAARLIPWSDGDSAVLSPKALGEHCRKAGIKPPPSLSEDDPACEAWERQHGEQYPWVAAMRDYRKTNALLEKLKTMRARTRPTDGCMSYGLKYFGAATGRWSGDAGFNCLTGDHEILTPEGWVRLDAWDETTSPIMQWSSNGRLSFVRGGKVTHSHAGPMVAVDNVRIRFLATPDHRVVYFNSTDRVAERPAQSLVSSRLSRIPTSGLFDENELERTDAELRFLVALAADGHINPKGRVSFGFKKSRKIIRMRSLLREINCTHTEVVSPGGVTKFYVNSSAKPDWMVKGFSAWLLNLSHRQALVVLDELHHWDGMLHANNGATIFYSVDREQARWVATLAHLHGKTVSVNEYPKRWDVYFKEACSQSHITPCRDVSVVAFQGSVYCPQVPTGMFVVRYRERIHITGNCQNLPRSESYGVDLRACIVPRPGNKLVTCDLAQIEPRCLAWLTGDQALLDQIAEGVPIYEAHARNTMGWRGGNLKKEDGRLYSLAKARVLGLGYGCGPDKFRAIAKTMCGLEISEREAQETVAAFRGSNRAVTGLWNRMQTDCRRSAGGNYEIELPSGRTLTYFNVSSRGGWTFQTERGGPVQRFYGGRLAENCLGGDTEVLSSRGWIPITDLLPHDLVWDGVEWVHHDGVVDQGERETIDFGGVRLTPDHKVLTRSGWVVAADASHEDAATVIEADDGDGVSRSTILYPEPEYQGRWQACNEGDPPPPLMRVYDILNAGPRRRFTVRGRDGKPLIVSNCVQATARDVFAEGLLRIERAGIPILFHCHDEVVCEVPADSAEEAAAEISRLMTTRPEWMPGLPLEAETQVSDRYCK